MLPQINSNSSWTGRQAQALTKKANRLRISQEANNS